MDTETATIEQYALRGERLELIRKHTEGVVECFAIPGFELEPNAAFDKAANLAALSRLLSGA